MTGDNEKGRRRWPIQRAPYPFVYSRDAWDIRRFNPLGQAPGGAGPSRWGVRFAVAFLVVLLGGSLLLLIVQMAQAIFH